MKHITPILEFLKKSDFYKASLNPKFWQGEKLDPEVRTKLIQIAQDFYKDIKEDIPIEDIQLTGSLANYNWTEYSDLDVHVIMDLSKINPDIELVKKAMDGVKFSWNLRHKVNIKGHDVELYAQDINQLHLASGLYSLMKDEWIRKPKFDPPSLDPQDISRKVESYNTEIEEIEKELGQVKSPSDANDVMEKASVLKKKISKARDEQLVHKGGEFSVENLVFKQLRNNGGISKLIEIKSKAYSMIYSEPMGAKSQKNDAIVESSIDPKDGYVLVIGPKVEGGKRLFMFRIDWVQYLQRDNRPFTMVGLGQPAYYIQASADGSLKLKTARFTETGLHKYAGLSDFKVVLNSKKTPYWFDTVAYTNPNQVLSDFTNKIKAIPDLLIV